MKKFPFIFLVLISSFCFSQKKLVFEYDTAGNQTLRALIETASKAVPEITGLTSEGEPTLQIYPNPVSEDLFIVWSNTDSEYVTRIEMQAYNAFAVENVKFYALGNRIVLNMSQRPAGVYYLKIHLKGGKTVERSVIKK